MAEPITPETDSEVDSVSLMILQRYGIERHDLGERLARHEFQIFRSEILGKDPFALEIELEMQGDPDPSDVLPELLPGYRRPVGQPALPVPLGRIAWVKRPEDLPVAGIWIEAMPGPALARLLLALLTEHHRKPFARLVFLCRELSPIHVLGRYGFICHHIAELSPARVATVMAARYGMAQIRTLDGGRKLWVAV